MARRRLRVPDSQKSPFLKLTALSAEATEELARGLADCKPALSVEGLAAQLVERLERPPDDLLSMLSVLLSLCGVAYSRGEKAERVAQAVTETAFDDELLSEANGCGSVEEITRRLTSLLDAGEALSVTSKAALLLMSHDRAFVSASIVSDGRPIFVGDADPAPVAMMVVHNLEIEVHTSDEHRSHFFSLDSTDLRSLRDVIDRAIKKEDALQTVIEKSGLYYLSIYQDEVR